MKKPARVSMASPVFRVLAGVMAILLVAALPAGVYFNVTRDVDVSEQLWIIFMFVAVYIDSVVNLACYALRGRWLGWPWWRGDA